jgi:cytochrome P450
MPDMYGSERNNVFVAKHSGIEYVLRNASCSPRASRLPRWRPSLDPENIDPPAHRKYRRLLDPLFGPKQMKELEPTSPGASTS